MHSAAAAVVEHSAVAAVVEHNAVAIASVAAAENSAASTAALQDASAVVDSDAAPSKAAAASPAMLPCLFAPSPFPDSRDSPAAFPPDALLQDASVPMDLDFLARA